MPRRQAHFLYELLLAMADASSKYGWNLTEAEARTRIKEFLPNYAAILDHVVEAGGNMVNMDEAILRQSQEITEREHQQRSGNDAMNKAVRDRVSGRFAAKGDSQNEYQSDSQSGDMNARLRARQSRIPPGTEESGMNDALRRAADRG